MIKKTSSIQRISIVLLVGYLIWELAIRLWASNLPPHDPLIRIDLIVIYPILIVLVIISLYQFFKTK